MILCIIFHILYNRNAVTINIRVDFCSKMSKKQNGTVTGETKGQVTKKSGKGNNHGFISEVNGGKGPRVSDGVDRPATPVSDAFPYQAPPTHQPQAKQGLGLAIGQASKQEL